MKSLSILFAAAVAVVALSAPAQADYIFSGSGSSGNFTGQASEPFFVNFSTGALNNWGSPGVGHGVTPYLEAQQAFGMQLTFAGEGTTINAASIAIGNGANCAGSIGGGTTFCSISPNDIWTAFLTGPNSISFLAQDPSFFLQTGQNYFVNVFFDGAAPTSFTGRWLTEFSPNPEGVPEPITVSIFGAGVAGALAMRRRKKQAA